MESSDDDTLSERSCVSEPSFRSERSGGSLSPCPSGPVGPPGDTLPWNLSKHERRKRKSQDSVLDPAERAVVRVAGKDYFLCFLMLSGVLSGKTIKLLMTQLRPCHIIHPLSIHHLILTRVMGGWSLSQLTQGEGRFTWTGHQSITGLHLETDNQAHSHSHLRTI
uniref:Uncharacterized protein n=1 Tax=Stegastes partitus TaxID=144197 RepID=A0A3B4ZEM5_9TELE